MYPAAKDVSATAPDLYQIKVMWQPPDFLHADDNSVITITEWYIGITITRL